jgi:hypothetical protein
LAGKDILVESLDWEAQGQGKKQVALDAGDTASLEGRMVHHSQQENAAWAHFYGVLGDFCWDFHGHQTCAHD